MANLEKLFHPNAVAIVGASEEEGKIGNIISKNLLELGFEGKTFFINPKHEKLFGKSCYKNLTAISEDIDLAIIAVPAKFVNNLVLEASDKVKNFVIISAGFSEVGEEGKAREKELEKIAQEKKLNILGPNCLGFIIPKIKLNASFSSGMPEAGNVSFVSQSGALISALMDISQKEKIGFSQIVSIGNKMDVDESKMLEFLAEDEETKVVGMYLEGIKDGQKFISVVQKISRIKPVVILKAGKTEKAQKAIASHTGALAGSDEIISAVFEKCGVIRAENLEEFFDILKLISNLKSELGKEMAILTNAGGAGVLATDAFQSKKIKLAEISQEIKSELKSFLPVESSVENPIDLLGDALADRYQKTLEILDKENDLETIMAILTPQNQTPATEIAKVLAEFKKNSQKNIVAVFVGGEKIQEALKILNENKIATYSTPEKAVDALEKYYSWKERAGGVIKFTDFEVSEGRRKKVLEIIQKAKNEKRKALYFFEASQIFELYEIPYCKSWIINSREEVKGDFNFPVVAKVDSDQVLHKSDQKALILNIKNEEELKLVIDEFTTKFSGEKIVIQEMAEKGTEIILGIKKDPTFGSVVVFGLGGIYTEIFKMTNLLIAPADRKEISWCLMNSQIKFLFEGERGQKKYNLEEMTEILFGLQGLALEIPEISELDVNPLIIYNNGKNALAVDIKIIF